MQTDPIEFEVFDPATGRVVAEAPAIGGAGTRNSVMLRMPEAHGAVEIRYWSAARQGVLKTLFETVGKGIGFLRSPTEVEVGAGFTVEWVGPAAPDQVYQLVDPATGAVLASQPAVDAGATARPVRMTAPAKPGAYRVRYVNGASGFVISDVPLDVDPK